MSKHPIPRDLDFTVNHSTNFNKYHQRLVFRCWGKLIVEVRINKVQLHRFSIHLDYLKKYLVSNGSSQGHCMEQVDYRSGQNYPSTPAVQLNVFRDTNISTYATNQANMAYGTPSSINQVCVKLQQLYGNRARSIWPNYHISYSRLYFI